MCVITNKTLTHYIFSSKKRHQRNAITTKRKRGNNTERRESLRLIHKTALPITEKSTKDTSKGQKEV